MEPTPTQTQTTHYKEILAELVEMAADIARAIHKTATQPNPPQEDPTIPFDRIARTIRKTIALAQALEKPQNPKTDRVTARRTIIRRIEDNIGHSLRNTEINKSQAEDLNAEFRERLDAPEFEHEIATRPIKDIIEEIIHDLGLDPEKGIYRWNRRTPLDVQVLNAKAQTDAGLIHPDDPRTIQLCLKALQARKP